MSALATCLAGPARRVRTLRPARLAAVALGLLLLGSHGPLRLRAAAADAALPPHTLPVLEGYPPHAPDPVHVATAGERAAWAEAMEACAERSGDDLRRGAHYASAAEAWRQVPGGVPRADTCLRAALAALDDAHPLDALVRLSLLGLALEAHLAPDALPLGARAWAWLERPAPRAGTPTAALDRLARERIRTLAPPALLHHAAAEGDLASAYAWAASMAAEPQPAWGAPAHLHEQAARLAYRSGRAPEARAHALEARRLAGDDETRARAAFWELHRAHGLLSPTGLLRPGPRVPGARFAHDVLDLHEALQGNASAGTYLLCSASCALQAGTLEAALAIYMRALDDPHLVRAAWRHAGLWGGLLPAVRVAEQLGRLDEAEQLLARIEALAGEPVPEAGGLRARLARARAAREEEHPPRAGAAPRAAAAPPGGLTLRGAGQAPPDPGPGTAPDGGAGRGSAPPGATGPGRAWATGLGAALVLCGLLAGAWALAGLWRSRRALPPAGPP